MNSTVEHAATSRRNGNTFFFDFGKAAFGRIVLEFDLPSPATVNVAAGECLKDGNIDPAPGGYRKYFSGTIHLPAGKGKTDFPFPAHIAPNPKVKKCLSPAGDAEVMPFRYVEISVVDGFVTPIRLAYFGGFNDHASEFVSSSDALNELWEFCKYSIKATNAFECYIDGERERLPYEGDAYINQLGHFCCDAAYHKAKNTIIRLLGTPTWPIEWRLLMPVLVRDYVLYSGDTAGCRAWQEALENAIFLDKINPDGLLPADFQQICNGEQVRTIIDWPPAERDNCEFGDVMSVPNSYLYAALWSMEELYGDEKYRLMAEKLKKSLHEQLKKSGIFVDCIGSCHSSIHALAFPIAWGVADTADYPALARQLAGRELACSVYGAQYVLDACFICGLESHAIKLLTRRGERSWLGMIDQGSSISMEAWNNKIKPNQDWNHAWGAAPANIIPRRLCGIRPVKPGFAAFTVEPKPGDLEFFRYRQPTPHGAITVEFRRGTGTTVTLPDNRSETFTDASRIFTME